jgi:hypothetical protein
MAVKSASPAPPYTVVVPACVLVSVVPVELVKSATLPVEKMTPVLLGTTPGDVVNPLL